MEPSDQSSDLFHDQEEAAGSATVLRFGSSGDGYQRTKANDFRSVSG